MARPERQHQLRVGPSSFDACNATKPLVALSDGATTVRLNRSGFCCFISGEPGHYEQGQRLVMRVMVHRALAAVPSPDDASPPLSSSAPSCAWDRVFFLSVLHLGPSAREDQGSPQLRWSACFNLHHVKRPLRSFHVVQAGEPFLLLAGLARKAI